MLFLYVFDCVCVGISGFFLGSEGRCSSKDQLVLSGGYTAHTHHTLCISLSHTQTHTECRACLYSTKLHHRFHLKGSLTRMKAESVVFSELCISVRVCGCFWVNIKHMISMANTNKITQSHYEDPPLFWGQKEWNIKIWIWHK